jgi:hypothetical protein
MTLSTTRQQMPDQMFIHESPNNSSTDLAELGLPQPAFRRRSNASGTGLSSNRSSMHSLTSEELWKMDQEANQPDLSNPTRQAKERPLDTVRRLSRGYDMPTMSQLPGEVICKSTFPFVLLPANKKGHQLWTMNHPVNSMPPFGRTLQRVSLKSIQPRDSRFENAHPEIIHSIPHPTRESTYIVQTPCRDPNQ